jgi:lipopolysaccharide transport system ATP-binding protein
MPRPVIEIERISKRYRIRGQREPYLSLRDELAKTARRLGGGIHGGRQDFWALRDVSFAVNQGEAVGIIGRNGAGKSTLLKILTRITPPTRGRVTMRGRVASLLEVGTGFHPELTGRENIYLNGAILGMTRAEVKRRFDEIVAFSEVEKFLDTPVKRYSSGMYVRLAFAVAAHLEPEMLIVDEVLAVGDAAFQKKCLGKMGEVAKAGRTVLFVSHNMAAIESLTSRAILFEGGAVSEDASTATVIGEYLSLAVAQRSASGQFIRNVRVGSDGDGDHRVVRTGDPVVFDVIVDPNGTCIRDAQVGIGVEHMLGTRLFTVGTYFSGVESLRIEGRTRVRCRIKDQFLVPGSYPLKVSLSSRSSGPIESIEGAFRLDVHPRDLFGNGKIPGSNQGALMVTSEWHCFAAEPGEEE